MLRGGEVGRGDSLVEGEERCVIYTFQPFKVNSLPFFFFFFFTIFFISVYLLNKDCARMHERMKAVSSASLMVRGI